MVLHHRVITSSCAITSSSWYYIIIMLLHHHGITSSWYYIIMCYYIIIMVLHHHHAITSLRGITSSHGITSSSSCYYIIIIISYTQGDARFIWNSFLLRELTQQSELFRYCIPIMLGCILYDHDGLTNLCFSLIIVTFNYFRYCQTKLLTNSSIVNICK